MAFKWQLIIVNALVLHVICCNAFIIPQDPDCYNYDNETTHSMKEKCSWLLRFQHNLGKYRNFYANLLQEENQNFAVEIQELYNIISSALVEQNVNKKHQMLYYTIWLVETTKNLEDFLTAKGISNI